eukprot:10974124-Lingulodinium_polyedra.AAC.1
MDLPFKRPRCPIRWRHRAAPALTSRARARQRPARAPIGSSARRSGHGWGAGAWPNGSTPRGW